MALHASGACLRGTLAEDQGQLRVRGREYGLGYAVGREYGLGYAVGREYGLGDAVGREYGLGDAVGSKATATV